MVILYTVYYILYTWMLHSCSYGLKIEDRRLFRSLERNLRSSTVAGELQECLYYILCLCCVLYTVHSILYIYYMLYTLYTIYYIPNTLYYILYALYYIVYIVYYIYFILHTWMLHSCSYGSKIEDRRLFRSLERNLRSSAVAGELQECLYYILCLCYVLYTVHYILYTICYILYILYTVSKIPSTIHCMLYTIYYILCTMCYILYTALSLSVWGLKIEDSPALLPLIFKS